MARRVFAADQGEAPRHTKPSKGPIPRRTLGKTGERVSIVGIGGHHLGRALVEESESIRIVRTALDSGANFLDNSWDYNDGESEIRVGKALRDGYRDKAFLMTKIDGRDKASAAKQIDDSLRRLQTDRIDLMQFHEVIRMNDPDRIFASGGAIEAVLDAKKAGKLRYIGFTGHKSPQIHLHMLRTADSHGFTFDTVQMPLNVMDAHFDSFEHLVLPVLVQRDIGVLGHEGNGRRQLPAQWRAHSNRMPALLDESADQRGNHRLRLDANIGAGAGCRAHVSSYGRHSAGCASREDRNDRRVGRL